MLDPQEIQELFRKAWARFDQYDFDSLTLTLKPRPDSMSLLAKLPDYVDTSMPVPEIECGSDGVPKIVWEWDPKRLTIKVCDDKNLFISRSSICNEESVGHVTRVLRMDAMDSLGVFRDYLKWVMTGTI